MAGSDKNSDAEGARRGRRRDHEITRPRAELESGRVLCESMRWAEAYEALAAADCVEPLEAQDLERLAQSAYMLGREDDYARVLDRAHHAHHADGRTQRAVRCAFWLGLHLALTGHGARASGWFARAERLLEGAPHQQVERGYLMLAEVERLMDAGDDEAAFHTATAAVELGERFDDADLIACGRHLQGMTLLARGEVEAGLRLLDDVMLSVTRGELSPLVTGLLYCNVIDGCRRVCAFERSSEWTVALSRWCDSQPQMVAFTGKCLVHRAEVLLLRGEWDEALSEAEQARDRLTGSARPSAAAPALYQVAEVLRLRGNLEEAERAYREVGDRGWDTQPGLALLRVAQGRVAEASASIRRAIAEVTDPADRARYLPACVEIALLAGAHDEARRSCTELEEIASRLETRWLSAAAATACGSVALKAGDGEAACRLLRRACELERELDAPYWMARARELLGLAYRLLGDEDGGTLELQAAMKTFERLGAIPDVERIAASLRSRAPAPSHGLTARELQVLRLVASGKTNKQIAADLSLREKTIERHLSNIFNKLGVESRTAAASYAYEHELVG